MRRVILSSHSQGASFFYLTVLRPVLVCLFPGIEQLVWHGYWYIRAMLRAVYHFIQHGVDRYFYSGDYFDYLSSVSDC